MGRVILGELSLRWCGNCDLPIIEQRKCSICNGTTFRVKHTPPGDIRPAFDADIIRIKEVIALQFGPAAVEKLIGKGSLVVLNSVPSLDRMDEIIIHGRVIGNLKFKLLSGRYFFIPQDFGMSLLDKMATSNVVIVDDGAIPFIEKGASCLAPGITKVVGEFEVEDEVLVCDKHGSILMSGAAQMTSVEMIREKRGVAVKSRRRTSGKDYPVFIPEIEPSWDRAVEANAYMLLAKVNKARKFIRQVIEDTHLPMAVSYSGGKDSLATLLLVLEAGYKPDLLFINTGLELPETIENVHEVADKYSLEIVTFDAGDAFYRALEYFGPPSKDFRWCCKICKLGPATRLIKKKYPKGLLSFIGQRQYESLQRKKKGEKWINPWVPNQQGFSPIQKWNALTVWLYIFREKGTYNPWYERGPARIGCWLCPASSVADLKGIRDGYDGSNTFFEYLKRWAEEKGFSSRWIDLGLWRWRHYPGSVNQVLKERKSTSYDLFPDPSDDNIPAEMNSALSVGSLTRGGTKGIDSVVKATLLAHQTGQAVTCQVKGHFNRKVSLKEVARLASILGRIVSHDNEILKIEDLKGGIIKIYETFFTIEGEESSIDLNVKDAISVLKRAIHCLGCGVCLGRCPAGALSLEDMGEREKVLVDATLCIMCRKCLGPCPVENFEPGEKYRFRGL